METAYTISILLSEYEDLYCELRLKCTQELIKNLYLYDTNNFNNYSFPDVYSYEKDILNRLKNCNIVVSIMLQLCQMFNNSQYNPSIQTLATFV